MAGEEGTEDVLELEERGEGGEGASAGKEEVGTGEDEEETREDGAGWGEREVEEEEGEGTADAARKAALEEDPEREEAAAESFCARLQTVQRRSCLSPKRRVR